MQTFNLRHATFKQTLVYAKMVADMTIEEIAEASGISKARISRYFQEHDAAYTPSPALIPVFCRALGNTILADWVQAQVEDLREVPAISTVQDLTVAVMRATANTGALNSKTVEAIADGRITPAEARALQAHFRSNGLENFRAVDALEPLAGGGV